MLTIGNYHYIRDDFSKPYPSIFGVTPANFQKQLEVLKTTGSFVTPKQLLENYEAIVKSKENYYLITFDDGLKEQYDLALPILHEQGIEALFFINSMNYVEKKVSLVHKIHLVRSEVSPKIIIEYLKKNGLNTEMSLENIAIAVTHYKYDDIETAKLKYLLNFKLDKVSVEKVINSIFENYFKESEIIEDLYMTFEQLKTLASLSMLGSHTHSHLPLGLLKEEELYQEIINTKSFLSTLTSNKIEFISYPYGSMEACQDPVARIAAELGYTIGLTMNRGVNRENENKLLLNRYACNDLPGWIK